MKIKRIPQTLENNLSQAKTMYGNNLAQWPFQETQKTGQARIRTPLQKKKKNHRNTHLSLIRIFFLFKPPGTRISLQISLKPFRRVFIAFLNWAQFQIWFPLVTKCKLWSPQRSLSDRLYPCQHSVLASELSPLFPRQRLPPALTALNFLFLPSSSVSQPGLYSLSFHPSNFLPPHCPHSWNVYLPHHHSRLSLPTPQLGITPEFPWIINGCLLQSLQLKLLISSFNT